MRRPGMNMNIKQDEERPLINDVIAGSYPGCGMAEPPRIRPRHPVGLVALRLSRRAAAPTPPADGHRCGDSDGPVGNNCDNLVNFSRFNDPVINKDLETGRTSTDPATRAKRPTKTINKEFAKQVWEAWAYWSMWTMPYQTNVHGILGPNLPTATKPDASSQGAAPFTGLVERRPTSRGCGRASSAGKPKRKRNFRHGRQGVKRCEQLLRRLIQLAVVLLFVSFFSFGC